jgi:hypothetical protein
MDELLNAMLEAAKPHLVELMTAVLVAGSAWLRAKLQAQAAASATFEVELAHRDRKNAGDELLPGEQRKKLAMLKVQSALPLLAQPFSRKGMEKLVERKVRQAHKRADSALGPEGDA